MSLIVGVVALLLPGGSHAPAPVSDISTTHSDPPAVDPVSVPVVTLPQATPDEAPGIAATHSGPITSPAAGTPHGGTTSSVVDGAATTPPPGSCSGGSMSHESHDYGRYGTSRTRIRHGDDSGCGD